MITRDEVVKLDKAALAALLREGHAIDPEQMAGRDFRGVSLGVPAVFEKLTWKTFQKSFREEGARLVGHNVRLEQTGLDGPTRPKQKRGAPWTFGPFEVTPLPSETPFGCREGLLLDYGKAHPIWHPMSPVRDVLVALAPGSVDLLLGALYVELGGQRIATPSYFTLEPAENVGARG